MIAEEILNKNWKNYKYEQMVNSDFYNNVLLISMEEYAKQQWNEAIIKASESVSLTTTKELWDDPKEGAAAYMDIIIIDKNSILKLLK